MQERAKAVSDRIISRHGGTALLQRTTTTGGGPSDPTGGTTTTESWTVQFIEGQAKAEFIAATLILTTDLVGTIQPHPDVTPRPGDLLTVNGKPHNVLNAAPVRPDPQGPVVHFAIHARA